jgi:UDP-N-acetylmuramoyl-L-alanyl-D-glutamate--2,6-diaminopimelate ligase
MLRPHAIPGRTPFPLPPAWVNALTHVGVTGTNGKTSTTRFVAAALGSLARPVPSITTVGSFLDAEPIDAQRNYKGMLATLNEARRRGARYAALEVTSETLALGFAKRWPFKVGIFTNLTHDHLDAHGSAEHYFASKAQLFHCLPADGGYAILNACDDVAELLSDVTPQGVRRLAYGVPSRGKARMHLDASATDVAVSIDGTRSRIALGSALGGGEIELVTRAIGHIFIENALAALVAALALGASRAEAAAAIAEAEPPPGRFEVVARNPDIVVDYAHTPDALARTIDTARALTRGKVSVVFGAGGNRDRAKRPTMGAACTGADRVILTSDNPRSEDPRTIASAIAEAVPRHVHLSVELDRARAIRQAVCDAGSEDIVIIAGKGHETTQELGPQQLHFSDRDTARSEAARHRMRASFPIPFVSMLDSKGG